MAKSSIDLNWIEEMVTELPTRMLVINIRNIKDSVDRAERLRRDNLKALTTSRSARIDPGLLCLIGFHEQALAIHQTELDRRVYKLGDLVPMHYHKTIDEVGI